MTKEETSPAVFDRFLISIISIIITFAFSSWNKTINKISKLVNFKFSETRNETRFLYKKCKSKCVTYISGETERGMRVLDSSIRNFARRQNRTNIRVPLITFGLGFWPIISLYDVSRRRTYDLPFDWWKIKPTTRESSVFSTKKHRSARVPGLRPSFRIN